MTTHRLVATTAGVLALAAGAALPAQAAAPKPKPASFDLLPAFCLKGVCSITLTFDLTSKVAKKDLKVQIGKHKVKNLKSSSGGKGWTARLPESVEAQRGKTYTLKFTVQGRQYTYREKMNSGGL